MCVMSDWSMMNNVVWHACVCVLQLPVHAEAAAVRVRLQGAHTALGLVPPPLLLRTSRAPRTQGALVTGHTIWYSMPINRTQTHTYTVCCVTSQSDIFWIVSHTKAICSYTLGFFFLFVFFISNRDLKVILKDGRYGSVILRGVFNILSPSIWTQHEKSL